MESFNFGDVVRHTLERTSVSSNYIADCFITSELGYSDAIAKCLPGSVQQGSGGFVGVGPCQNLSYIGALRPRVAIVCDSRPDNVLEHLIFKVLMERATDPLDYLLLLFSRTCADRPADDELRCPQDLVDAFDRGVVSDVAYKENLAMLQSEMSNRWDVPPDHVDRIDYLYGEFFDRQLDMIALNRNSRIARECPTMREILLATTSTGWNFHFLTDTSRFRYVQEMHLRGRIIPLLGNLCTPESVALINDLLEHVSEVVDTIYLSNIEDHILERYVFWPDGSVTEPNLEGLITGDYATAYGQMVDSLEGLPTSPDAMLIRFFYPGACWGRHIGALPYLEPAVYRLKTFLSAWRAQPQSIFDTYL